MCPSNTLFGQKTKKTKKQKNKLNKIQCCGVVGILLLRSLSNPLFYIKISYIYITFNNTLMSHPVFSNKGTFF